MALSDWDTLAFGPDGKPCNGSFDFEGTGVELYKNWAYIRNADMWIENGGYTHPTIAEFRTGYISIGGVQLTATRGPQNSIFLLVEATERVVKNEGEGDKDYVDYVPHFFGGIAGSGWDDEQDRLMKAMHFEWDERGEPDSLWHCSGYEDNGTPYRGFAAFYKDERGEVVDTKRDYVELHIRNNQRTKHLESQWTGIRPETYNEFLQWLKDIGKDHSNAKLFAWIEKIEASKPVRFNQGNAFFTNHAGTDLEASEPGQSEPPLIIQMLRSDRDDENKVVSLPALQLVRRLEGEIVHNKPVRDHCIVFDIIDVAAVCGVNLDAKELLRCKGPTGTSFKQFLDEVKETAIQHSRFLYCELSADKTELECSFNAPEHLEGDKLIAWMNDENFSAKEKEWREKGVPERSENGR